MIPKDILREHSDALEKWCILMGYRGSISHGMYIPKNDPSSIDDKDAMGICILPDEYYYGLKKFGSRGTKEIKSGEWDIVVYELTKALRLLAGCNPNILTILWLDQVYYLKKTPAGELLIKNRHLFVSKKAYHSFVGYASGQLHRMTHSAFGGYMGAKRKELVEKFGYDTKNAAHLIRILRMGIEFISTGELQVLRPDASELLDIKRGEWGLDKIKTEAEKLFSLSKEALIHSSIPDNVDMEAVSKLGVEMRKEWEKAPADCVSDNS